MESQISSDVNEMKAQLEAIYRTQAMIEFKPDGTILGANDNFCRAVNYSLDEIRGQHHSIFAESEYRSSAEYRNFWERLNRGESFSGEFKRVAKGGKAIWIQGAYTPLKDAGGQVYKVVKFVVDITAGKVFQAAVSETLADCSNVMKAIASGDLTQRMNSDGGGQFCDLKESVNSTAQTLTEIVSNIRAATESVTTASGEIASGNSDLSQRTEEQASSLEETAASIEELSSTVRQNADNARAASQLAVSARDQAEKGGQVVSNAVQAMSSINDASKKIADIIGVIDEIAFQTNLLALNAAVEAARAGEQGRGFAVVASEVRNLAQRSAGAAKEIKALIGDSVRKVNDGSKLVNESGETLNQIVGSVKKVADIVAEIAAASQEQASGIEQVNAAVSQMEQTTQQNAALVEEAAAASESLDSQSRQMKALLEFFQLDNDSAYAAGAPQTNAAFGGMNTKKANPLRAPQRPVSPAVRPAARPLSPRPSITASAKHPPLNQRSTSPQRSAVGKGHAPSPAVRTNPPKVVEGDEWEEF